MAEPSHSSLVFLAARYVLVLLVGLWVLALARKPRPALVAGGALLCSLYLYFVIQLPLQRPWALAPGLDRLFNFAMAATATTGHSIFESYQAGFGDHEPLLKLLLGLLALGRPEHVPTIYTYFAPCALALLAASLYFGQRRDAWGTMSDHSRRFELALVVYVVLMLHTSPHESLGVFRSFWLMAFMLKPNHVLGFVLLPLWIRALTSRGPLVRTLGAGALLALLAWVFLLHWAYALVGLACYPVLARWLGKPIALRDAAVVGGISLLTALPYLAFLFWYFPPADTEVGRHIWQSVVVFRTGYHDVFTVGYEHGAVFLLSVLGLVGMARRRRPEDIAWLSLVVGAFVGWLLYLVAFAVRHVIEPEEFYFYTRFLLTVAAGSGAHFLLEWIRASARGAPSFRKHALPVFVLATVPLSVPYWWDPPSMDSYFRFATQPIPPETTELASWVRNTTSRDAVFVAAPDSACWIAALSGRRVLLTGSYRPPSDYEARAELTRRMLVARDPEAFSQAWSRYHVSHLALEEDYLASLGTRLSALTELDWLRIKHRAGSTVILEIDHQRLSSGECSAPGTRWHSNADPSHSAALHNDLWDRTRAQPW